jgi:hypothetical protein
VIWQYVSCVVDASIAGDDLALHKSRGRETRRAARSDKAAAQAAMAVLSNSGERSSDIHTVGGVGGTNVRRPTTCCR